MSDQFKQTKKLGTMDPVSDVAPIPNVADQESMAQALWRSGHVRGHRRGYHLGYSNGSSTLGRSWFFFTAMGFLVAGVLVGMTMQFMVSCGPDTPCGIQFPSDWGFAPINVEDR